MMKFSFSFECVLIFIMILTECLRLDKVKPFFCVCVFFVLFLLFFCFLGSHSCLIEVPRAGLGVEL